MVSVFGGTGFVGSAYCDTFDKESVVIPRDQRQPETNNILYFISTVHNYNVFEDPHLDIETNLTLLVETLEASRQKKDIIFNFISSWFVYGKTDDIPAHESSSCNPKGFYSITKRAAEQLLISYCETFDMNYRILRLCNVYGTRDRKVSKKRNALQYLTGEVANNRDIDLYDAGQNIRDFMHVEDVCSAINLVIEKAPLNDVINIGSGIPYKFIDLMTYVKKKTNSTSNIGFVEPPSFHKTVQVENMYLDVTKLSSLKFSPKYTIWSGIDEIIEDCKEKKL